MIDHSNRAHALLSASGASRWMACTPSARLEDRFPDTTSDYAKEGTVAHEICELTLRHSLVEITTQKYREEIEKISKDPLFSDEMLDYAQGYVDYIQEKRMKDSIVIIEERLDFSKYVPEGFGTGDCLILNGQMLTIIDFKYGKGVEVSAEENTQLKLYALGALEMFGLIYQIERVELCIYQPRISNISEWSISADDLTHWANSTVIPKAKMAWEGKGDFVAGNHCKFCRASARCKTLANYSAKVISDDFINEDGDLDKNLLEEKDIAFILDRAKTVRDWLSSVEEMALNEALFNGMKIPGYKIVEGRSVRVIKDRDALAQILIDDGTPECMLYKKTMLSITDLEKLVKKKRFNELVGHLIDKPRGKPTLVPESDRRMEWVRDDDFEVLA